MVYRNNRDCCLRKPFENTYSQKEEQGGKKNVHIFKSPYWELKRKGEKKTRSRLFWDSQVNGRAVLSTASLSKCFITLKSMSKEWRSELASGFHLPSKMSKSAQSVDKQKEPNRSHFPLEMAGPFSPIPAAVSEQYNFTHSVPAGVSHQILHLTGNQCIHFSS